MPILVDRPGITAEAQKEELIKCMAGLDGEWYWFTHYFYTSNKEGVGKDIFPDWEYLYDTLKTILEGGNILIEKSRQMMLSWLLCGHYLHQVQFNPQWSGFCTSRNERLVDDGGENATVRSIFGRILFGWRNQPDWMRQPLKFAHLKISNASEDMDGVIMGESANSRTGSGLAATIFWADEMAFIPRSEDVHSALMGATYDALVYVSTSNLTGNAFHRLRSDPDSGFKVVRLLWNLRPDRDQEWYNRKVKGMSPLQKAKEIDIEYEITTEAHIYPRFKYSTHTTRLEGISRAGKVGFSFDEGYTKGAAFLVTLEAEDGTLYVLEEVYRKRIHVWLEGVIDKARRMEVAAQLWDGNCIDEKGNPVAEPETDWLTIAEVALERYGIEVDFDAKTRKPSVDVTVSLSPESRATANLFTAKGFRVYLAGKDRKERIRKTDTMMIESEVTNKSRLIIARNCTNMISELVRYKWKEVGGVITDTPQDGADHACDALAYKVEETFVETVNRTPHSNIDDGWETDGSL